ncbi:cleft lip and palate transmembrane 1 [Wallemia mellicola]|nr:cleft lip and palate transmembrane 1 [Wallemia mellicola]
MPVSTPEDATNSVVPVQVTNLWEKDTEMDLFIKLSTSNNPYLALETDDGLPEIHWTNINYGDWNLDRTASFDIELPESVKNNGTLWADFFLSKKDAPINQRDPSYDPLAVAHSRKLLTRFHPKKKARKEKNLLSDDSSDGEDDEEDKETPELIVPYWHSNLTVSIIQDTGINIPYTQTQPAARKFIALDPLNRRKEGVKPETGYHYPIIYPNDFWLLRNQFVELNETIDVVPLHISLSSLSFFKFNIYANIHAGMEEQAQTQGTGGELDEFKRMLVETNPYFLALTALVTLLHTVFEFLAFKNDVSHWKGENHDMVGVSLRSIIANVIVQIIILLYLIDNNENASWTIIGGQAIGLVIEAWKITKAINFKILPPAPNSWLPFNFQFEDRKELSEDEKKTREYDALAFRYVSWVMVPVLIAYTIYSLLYETHRGWYSFVISTLTSFVYAFGFVQLVPQLILNYKLKSVAHMPGRAMVYKTLSTVIDDLFSFIIKMPLLHRLSCFRDDVVFLIYLYQRWIYSVDPNRLNEYGQATDEKIEQFEKEQELSTFIAIAIAQIIKMPMTRTSRRLQKLSPERKNTEADLLALNEKLNIRTPRKAQATVVHHDNESDLTDKEESGETSPKRKNGTMSVHKSPTKKQVTPEKRRTLRSKKSVTLTTESENDSTDKEDEEDALSRRSTRISKLQLTPEKKRPLRSKKSVTLAPESTKKALARESTFGETSNTVFKTPSKKTPLKTPRKTPSRNALKKEDTFDEFVQPRKSLVSTFNGVADSTVSTPKKSLNRQDSFAVATTPASTNVYAYARNRVRTMNASSDEDQLIGRESEIEAIRSFLESSQSSLYVSGPPGGGKTAAVKLVVNGYDGRMHWTNCMALSGVDNLLDELRLVKSKSKSLLVILDEIDTLPHEDLLELFKIAAENNELKLIGIANALDLTSNQLQNSDHPPVHLQVHPYTAQQLSNIINARLGEYKQLFMPQALELLSRKVSAMTGDIRQVVSVVTLCLDTVEKEQKKLRGAALCDVTPE